jgi:transposase
MPRNNFTLNLPGFTVEKVSGHDPLIYHAVYRGKTQCTHCASPAVRKKASRFREIAHESLGQRKTRIRVLAHKFYCKACHRYFNQRFAGINKHQRSTERLKEQVCKQHLQGICQKALSDNFKIGKTTIERWYHQFYITCRTSNV